MAVRSPAITVGGHVVRDPADAIADYLAAEAKSGDLLLVMSNGSFDGLCDKLLKKLGAEVPVEATRR